MEKLVAALFLALCVVCVILGVRRLSYCNKPLEAPPRDPNDVVPWGVLAGHYYIAYFEEEITQFVSSFQENGARLVVHRKGSVEFVAADGTVMLSFSSSEELGSPCAVYISHLPGMELSEQIAEFEKKRPWTRITCSPMAVPQ